MLGFSDWAGVGTFLLGVGAVITAAGAVAISRRTHRKVIDIDHAVNGKPSGGTTMVQQVQDLTDRDTAAYQEAVIPLLKKLVALAEEEAERK